MRSLSGQLAAKARSNGFPVVWIFLIPIDQMPMQVNIQKVPIWNKFWAKSGSPLKITGKDLRSISMDFGYEQEIDFLVVGATGARSQLRNLQGN
jgi:hypothetical protein